MSDPRWIIPDCLFVGLARKVKGHAPLAHFTAAGTDASARGRMQTVMNNSVQTWTLPNQPQWGFTLGGAAWKDEIRMEDPRGFSVNVRMDAVMHLMKECTVVNGVIQAACVWARSNGENVLLVVGSETHSLAQIQTRLAHSKVPLKQVQLGDWVTLNNGVQGVYLGKYHKLSFENHTWIRHAHENKLQVDDVARVAIWQPYIKRGGTPAHTQCIMFLTNPVVAAHASHDCVYTQAQAECKVNQLLQDASCHVQRTMRSYYSERVVLAAHKPIQLDQLQLCAEPIVCADAAEVNQQNHNVHWSPDSKSFWLWSGGGSRNNMVTVYEWDAVAFTQNQLKFVRQGPLSNNTASHKTLNVADALNNLYVIQVTYNTTLHNQFMVCI